MEVRHRCKCRECQSHTMADCINNRCYCCDLEDIFMALTKVDIEMIKA
jgi:hypothetical protein